MGDLTAADAVLGELAPLTATAPCASNHQDPSSDGPHGGVPDLYERLSATAGRGAATLADVTSCPGRGPAWP
jgi:hypothetical protein